MDEELKQMFSSVEPPKEKKKKKRAHKPTLRQIKAVHYINQGMTVPEAQRAAGYSPNQVDAKGKAKFLKMEGVQTLIGNMKNELVSADLTQTYMAIKMKEWVNATKVDHSPTEPDKLVPDYKTQLDAYDRWYQIMEQAPEKPSDGKLKRRVTFEDWIGKEEAK